MKTAEELGKELYDLCPGPLSLATSIEARDAEWRRLVEEAQAELDMVKGAFALHAPAFPALKAERDRLKGELAEARRLLTCVQKACGQVPACEHTTRAEVDALFAVSFFLAAAPAEQAQPTYDDGEGKPRPQLNVERLISSTPVRAAEQAQGEGAKASKRSCQFDGAGRCEWHEHDAGKPVTPAPAGGLLDDVNAQVAALARRVDASDLDFVTLERRVRWMEEEADRKAVIAAPPPPEAAGPGHAFVDHPLVALGTGMCCFVKGCGRPRQDHAVPPIPEGGAR